MKRPVVDYRTFRLSKLDQPEFSHLKLLFGWIIYFALFFLTETLIPEEKCTPVHCWIDNLIPFVEIFVIPYVFWYGLIVFSLIYFMLYDIGSFRGLQIYFIVTQLTAMTVYIFFPSRQDLRPTDFPRENLFVQIIRLLYALDTNTGVCPSLHVAYSLGIASAWLKKKDISTIGKTFFVGAAILICLSTMFIKQHSVLDFFAAIPICILAEWIAYGRSYWRYRNAKRE